MRNAAAPPQFKVRENDGEKMTFPPACTICAGGGSEGTRAAIG